MKKALNNTIGTIQGLKTMNDAQQLLKFLLSQPIDEYTDVIIKDVEGKTIGHCIVGLDHESLNTKDNSSNWVTITVD
jgi:hypothetical protein